jgi:hypothetical protein
MFSNMVFFWGGFSYYSLNACHHGVLMQWFLQTYERLFAGSIAAAMNQSAFVAFTEKLNGFASFYDRSCEMFG